MPLLHVRLFSDKTSISVPQGLRKAQFKLKGYRVLFTQDKHGYYHASVNTNLIQNGSVIAFTTANAPTSTTYDIPLLIDPDQKQTVYENCDWNLGMVDNLPSSIFFNITFFNCIQRTRFDRAFFNSNNSGFQNLFNNISQGTTDVVKVHDYQGTVLSISSLSNANKLINLAFKSKVNLTIGHQFTVNEVVSDEMRPGVTFFIKTIETELFQEDDDIEDEVTDPVWYANITASLTLNGDDAVFTNVSSKALGFVKANFTYTTPAVITQADINRKFDKTPLYPYLPGSDYVLGYKYDPQGKIIEGTGLLTNTNYYPSAAKYVNTGVHVHSNHDMDALYDDTCINADEVVQQVNSTGVIKGSGINRNAIIYPYTVDLLFEYY